MEKNDKQGTMLDRLWASLDECREAVKEGRDVSLEELSKTLIPVYHKMSGLISTGSPESKSFAVKVMGRICGYIPFLASDKGSNNITPVGLLTLSYMPDPPIPKEFSFAHAPYDELWSLYGTGLCELNDLDASEKALTEALKWNPIHIDSMLELACVRQQKKDIAGSMELYSKVLGIAHTNADIAHAYRGIGFSMVEKKDYDTGVACYTFSRAYDDSHDDDIEAEMLSIEDMSGKTYTKTSLDDVDLDWAISQLKSAGIQVGMSDFMAAATYTTVGLMDEPGGAAAVLGIDNDDLYEMAMLIQASEKAKELYAAAVERYYDAKQKAKEDKTTADL